MYTHKQTHSERKRTLVPMSTSHVHVSRKQSPVPDWRERHYSPSPTPVTHYRNWYISKRFRKLAAEKVCEQLVNKTYRQLQKEVRYQNVASEVVENYCKVILQGKQNVKICR